MARLRPKGRRLNHLHLNAVKEEQVRNVEEEEEEEEEKQNAPHFTWDSTVKDRKKLPYGLHHHSHHHNQVHHHTQERVHAQHRQEERQVESTKVPDNDIGINDCHDSSPLPDSAVKSQVNNLEENIKHQNTDLGQYNEPLPQKKTKPKLQTANVGQYNEFVSTRQKLKTEQFFGSDLSSRDHLKTSSTILLPQGLKAAKSHKLTDRIKDSRLRGSDLYVARLSLKDTSCDQNPHDGVSNMHPESKPTPSDDHSLPTPLTGSLHDELRFCEGKEDVKDDRSLRPSPRQRVATLSRPCYRCISYMHSAGVKRVFWTNARGEWEGAKVQELVDAFENPDGSLVKDVKALFVTKHEVLMLRKGVSS